MMALETLFWEMEENNGTVTYSHPREAAHLVIKLQILWFIWYRLIT